MHKFFIACCVLLAACFFLIPGTVRAQDDGTYAVDYTFNFYIQPHTSQVDVELDIILTNVRSDVYITEYSIAFPQNFMFRNLHVSNESGDIPFVTSEDNKARKITFKFPEPKDGKHSQNHLKLRYSLDNMHTRHGRINEVVMPLLISDDTAKVHATLHLPDNFNRSLSISKPVPSSIGFKQISWENLKARTILAIFGESQVYDVRLSYSLKNNGIRSLTQAIALPPETLYQKVFVKSLEPIPTRTYTDEDGNFLAEYTLGAREQIDIVFKGFVEVFVKPQASLQEYMRQRFIDQGNYLLTEEPFWRLGKQAGAVPLDSLHTVQDIYTYTVKELSYDIRRLTTDSSRYGAEKALENPNNAVCMEYTDLFIALAREKGIPAREVQGIGFSQNQRIRPQSLILDELHAWPEFYDRQQETWLQIDPTWEDTSGIDYFSAFDVNHIALAIHGKNPQLPLPAGMYKTSQKQDVFIDISSTKPTPNVHLEISSDIPEELTKGEKYSSEVQVTNTGNSFVHAINIVPEAQHVTFHTGELHVEYLAPFETRTISISYTPDDLYTPSDTISFTYDGAVLGSQSVRITEPSQDKTYFIVGILSALAFASTLYVYLKARKI